MKKLTDNADPHENRAILDSEMMYMVLGSNKNYDEIAEMIHLQDFSTLEQFLVKKFVETVQTTVSENS